MPAPAEGGQRGGQVLLDGFHDAAERLGVDVRTSSPIVELVLGADGAAAGVIVATGTRRRAIRAARGVVFATGGFTHDRDLVRQYLGGPYAVVVPPLATRATSSGSRRPPAPSWRT